MSKFNLRGRMTVTVHQARNLANRELVGKMDPFTVIKISGSKDEKFKTKVAKDQHQTPVWEQSYIFNLEGKEELLHANVWNEATLGDDHIGRLDLTLDAMDMSGKPRWYQLKDKTNFTKQTGELSMSIVFEGTGLPAGSVAFTTNEARIHPPSAAVASPASPAPIAAAAPVPSPVAVVAPPVVHQQQQQQQQPQQQFQSQQPNYQQQPQQQQQQQQQQQFASPPQQQQQYGSQQQQQPQYQQQPPQQQFQSQQPQYAPPQQPMYQQPPAAVYAAPPMQPIYASAAPVYASAAPVYASQPVYQSQPQVVFQAPPQVTFQPAPQVVFQQQPQVVYQTQQGYPGQARPQQIIGYWPNGQPRYA